MSDKTMISAAVAIFEEIRRNNPLVHCLTNTVTMNDCANALLAAGASPAMIDDPSESGSFARIADGVYVNIGTLNSRQEEGMKAAVISAGKAGKPVVIDPVGCAAVSSRADFVRTLREAGPFAVIKGNMAEIMALAGEKGTAKGVDSADDEERIETAAVHVAIEFACVAVATGRSDVVTDGASLVRLGNGTPMLKRITGAGCMAGALITAAIAAIAEGRLSPLADKFGTESARSIARAAVLMDAAVAGLSALSVSGELAAAAATQPGSFRTALIDSIGGLTMPALRDRIKLSGAK
jgi:hydroxyethylthiazole kinase